ncbi:hypothetical protein ACEUA8_01525 [Aeromonas veronii]
MATIRHNKADVDLEIVTGDTFIVECVYTEKNSTGDDEPVYLKNIELTGQARLQDGDEVGFPLVIDVINQDFKDPNTGLPVNRGKFNIRFTPEFTQLFGSKTRNRIYLYDVQAKDVEGNVYTFMGGKITFTPDITRKDLVINLP